MVRELSRFSLLTRGLKRKSVSIVYWPDGRVYCFPIARMVGLTVFLFPVGLSEEKHFRCSDPRLVFTAIVSVSISFLNLLCAN